MKLERELGVFGTTMMGLGSIIGTGVFVSIGIAAGVAGPAVLLGIVLAAAVATCNGLNSAQLAANHPVSGGTYEYGYRYLDARMGFCAGWLFLCAKTASAATAALGFSGYLLNALGARDWPVVPVALAGLGGVSLLVLVGLRRSSAANVAIVSLTLLSLGYFVFYGATVGGGQLGLDGLRPFFGEAEGPGQMVRVTLEASALMFVAFTGYGRIATMGEEVKEPRRTIPRAIITTLVVSSLLYVAVAWVALTTVGAPSFAAATVEAAAPLEVVARAFVFSQGALLLAVGATAAMLGVLLNLVLGLSRVLLAMGRRGDMPPWMARIDTRRNTPTIAVVVVTLAIAALVALGDIGVAWSFSAFTVLLYYAITNLAALKLKAEERYYPRLISWLGLGASVFLAFWVDTRIWLVGIALIGVGLVWQRIAQRLYAKGVS
ncbi:MAG: amino acid permease [Bradymonadaceae bacterium]|nr:amino acid permease [Lujinxingiaceae bacterium]